MFENETEAGPGASLEDGAPKGVVAETRLLGLLSSVGPGEMIPKWHGVWRYDFASERASTALIGLNLILVLAWRLIGWAKQGGLNVAADPRQAFVDGLNAGRAEAFREMPEEVHREYTLANARYEQGRKMATLYAPHVAMRSEANALIVALEKAMDSLQLAPDVAQRATVFAARARALYKACGIPIDERAPVPTKASSDG